MILVAPTDRREDGFHAGEEGADIVLFLVDRNDHRNTEMAQGLDPGLLDPGLLSGAGAPGGGCSVGAPRAVGAI